MHIVVVWARLCQIGRGREEEAKLLFDSCCVLRIIRSKSRCLIAKLRRWGRGTEQKHSPVYLSNEVIDACLLVHVPVFVHVVKAGFKIIKDIEIVLFHLSSNPVYPVSILIPRIHGTPPSIHHSCACTELDNPYLVQRTSHPAGWGVPFCTDSWVVWDQKRCGASLYATRFMWWLFKRTSSIFWASMGYTYRQCQCCCLNWMVRTRARLAPRASTKRVYCGGCIPCRSVDHCWTDLLFLFELLLLLLASH